MSTEPLPIVAVWENMRSLWEGAKMARREYQCPSVLTRKGVRGDEFYIRYRIKVLNLADKKLTVQRREKWHVLGLCARMTKRQAEREKDKILREVNAQVYTLQSRIPFTAFVEIFDANHIATLATPTQSTYRQQLRTHVTPALGALRLGDIGPLEVQQLFRALETGGIAKSTRRVIRGVLGTLFNCARKWRYLETPSPMPGVDIGGGPRRVRERRVPTLEDVQRLIAICDQDIPLLIETLYVTGMRISEAAGLQAADLDFEHGYIHVRRRDCRGDIGDTKSEAGSRDLGMGWLLEALRVHVAGKKPDERVFLHDGKPLIDNNLLGNYLTPRMEQLGIKFLGFGWHTFRRLHLTMAHRGMNMFELRQQAGHADIRTTQDYIVDDAQRRAVAVGDLPRLILVKKGA